MGVAALLFLKANWKWIAVGVALASLVGYIEVIKLERDHYKKEYQETSLKLDTLIVSSKTKEDKLEADNVALTNKYASTLRTANDLVTVTAKLNGENIAKDKELASIKLSLNAVRLFNASKQSTTTEGKPAEAVSGNDGTTAAVAKALEEKSQAVANANQTLADLLQVVNINDANHLKCIKTVEQWQGFWKDHVATVEASNAASP